MDGVVRQKENNPLVRVEPIENRAASEVPQEV